MKISVKSFCSEAGDRGGPVVGFGSGMLAIFDQVFMSKRFLRVLTGVNKCKKVKTSENFPQAAISGIIRRMAKPDARFAGKIQSRFGTISKSLGTKDMGVCGWISIATDGMTIKYRLSEVDSRFFTDA